MIEPVAVVVPALNAAPTLPAVLAGVRLHLPGATIIGIDDGSTDDTRAVLDGGCDEAIHFDVNRGKGAALRAGFARALERGANAVLTIDADGQHDPAYAPGLVRALEEADIVIGARRRQGTPMPLRRRISNALSSRAISAAAGCSIADTQSGYRALRADVLRKVNAVGDRYEYETDLLIKAGRAGFRINCVPISTIYGSPSHFRELRDAGRVVGLIIRRHLDRVR